MHWSDAMKTPLIPALALISFVFYLGTVKRDAPLEVSSAQLDGYGRVSIDESSHDNMDLYFAFRAARGDGMTTSDVRVRGELQPGSLDGADIQVSQQWRPHIGAWTDAEEAERVVAEVEELADGSMRVAYVAYFDHGTSQGAFVVAPPSLAK